MNNPLKITHITDTHIGEIDALRGKIDSRKNFLNVLQQVKREDPDIIVLGGDLAGDRGEIASYRWIKQEMDSLNIPYQVMAGNHDITENMYSIFKLKEGPVVGSLYDKKKIKGRTLIFLDSSSHKVDQFQLKQLEMDAKKSGEEIMLFIHHPPLECGCLFMDMHYPLLNRDEVFPVLQSISNLNYIICGHYHTEKTVFRNGKTFLITPSTMLQFSQNDPDFKIDFNVDRPSVGWRTIFWDDVGLKTRVKYLPFS